MEPSATLARSVSLHITETNRQAMITTLSSLTVAYGHSPQRIPRLHCTSILLPRPKPRQFPSSPHLHSGKSRLRSCPSQWNSFSSVGGSYRANHTKQYVLAAD